MEFSANQIAQLLSGTVEGNENVMVSSVSKIEEGLAGTLTFLANPKYLKYIYTTQASIVLVNEDFKAEKEIESTLIRVKDAYQAFATLLEYSQTVFFKYHERIGVDSLAYIHSTATIGENVYIAPFAYIGENVKVGDNTKIFPHVYLSHNVEVGSDCILNAGVKVHNDCKIGNKCILHSGAVVGSDGFGFAPDENNIYKKIPQIGNVIIEDNVEIGANTTIDRATLGSTVIKKGVKLDNLIQIAHNVEIGENTVIAAQTGISGSARIGKNCMFGGQVGIVGHLTIADGVKIGAQSGIPASITEEGVILQGAPAIPIRNHHKAVAVWKNLPDLDKKVFQLERQLKELKEKLNLI